MRPLLAAAIIAVALATGPAATSAQGNDEGVAIVALGRDGSVTTFDAHGSLRGQFEIGDQHTFGPVVSNVGALLAISPVAASDELVVLDVTAGRARTFEVDAGAGLSGLSGTPLVVVDATSGPQSVIDIVTGRYLRLKDHVPADVRRPMFLRPMTSAAGQFLAVTFFDLTAEPGNRTAVVDLTDQTSHVLAGRAVGFSNELVVTAENGIAETVVTFSDPVTGLVSRVVTIAASARNFGVLATGAVVAVDDNGGVWRIDTEPAATDPANLGVAPLARGENYVPIVRIGDGSRAAIVTSTAVYVVGTAGDARTIAVALPITRFVGRSGSRCLSTDGGVIDTDTGAVYQPRDPGPTSADGCTYALDDEAQVVRFGSVISLNSDGWVAAISDDGASAIVGDDSARSFILVPVDDRTMASARLEIDKVNQRGDVYFTFVDG